MYVILLITDLYCDGFLREIFMEKKNIFINDELDVIEQQICNAMIDVNNKEIANIHNEIIAQKQYEDKKIEAYQLLYAKVSNYCGFLVDMHNFETVHVPEEIQREFIDEIFGNQNNLIRSVHEILPYSLLKRKPELIEYIPVQNSQSPLDLLCDKSLSRACEITREATSEATVRAHIGDLVYMQAWLSAIGFSFKEAISEKEVLSYIIQHAESLDHEVDEKLVNQNYKTKLGPHSLATVKRRLGSLSVFLELEKLPNPCRTKEIRLLLNKLTKKYGGSRPAGKAITKDILDDMLEVCGDKLLDLRDKAMLLFAWGSGGRRRSEVAMAEMKDLVRTPEGNFIYNMPKSKTDQDSKGFHVPVKGRVAKSLDDWLIASGVTDGHIFRAIGKGGDIRGGLSPVDINRVVKRRLKQAGYNEKQFGAHSLRSGFVTEAGRKGKHIGDVMQLTTHKSITTVMKYYQAGNIINNSAANLAD